MRVVTDEICTCLYVDEHRKGEDIDSTNESGNTRTRRNRREKSTFEHELIHQG